MHPIQSDITILDKLLALNLTVNLWSARRKMTAEDMGGANLPPEDLASLGSKRIADPETLKIFGTLKARAVNYLDRHGIRFMCGWAIPEEQAGEIVNELMSIRDEFQKAKEAFLTDYDKSIQNWINKHSQWANIISNSTVGPDYVRARMSFKWQIYRVVPLLTHADQTAVLEGGLAEEVTGLGSTLFEEVAHDAEDIWKRVFMGKTEVTHRALSPLRTLHKKLMGLSFVEPHVAPVADIIKMAIRRMPAKGNIAGTELLLLQGLVCLLRDSDALLTQAQSLMDGYGPATVLDGLLDGSILPDDTSVGCRGMGNAPNDDVLNEVTVAAQETSERLFTNDISRLNDRDNRSANDENEPLLPQLPETPAPRIASYGLW